MTSNGYSPLTVRGLDPGIMYSVTINVFNDNKTVFRNETVIKTITVMGDQSGKIICICTCVVRVCTYTYALMYSLLLHYSYYIRSCYVRTCSHLIYKLNSKVTIF